MNILLKIHPIFICLIIIFGCSNENFDAVDFNKLIKPDFAFTTYFLNCSLKNDSSLLELESFFSSFNKAKKNEYLGSSNLFLYFPDSLYLDTFVLNLVNTDEENTYSNFIKDLSDEGFDKLASCNFNINGEKGIKILSSKSLIQNENFSSEILRCKYKDGYNFATFRVSIDKFTEFLDRKDFDYEVIYAENDNSNNFLWINNFYSKDYSKYILENWQTSDEALQIKNEFTENAQCIDSRFYKVFKVI